jgi:predicted GNAT superfamily acetyltransferase
VNEFDYSPIKENFLEQCHKINEENVPEVGSRSLDNFNELVDKSDFSLCVAKDNLPLGYIICFQNNKNTNEYMDQIGHNNYIEIRKRVDSFLYVDRIAIDTKYRNKKLGSNLYYKAIDFAKENSLTNLAAEINLLPIINTSSLNFHKKFEFVEIDTIKYSDDYKVSLQKMVI